LGRYVTTSVSFPMGGEAFVPVTAVTIFLSIILDCRARVGARLRRATLTQSLIQARNLRNLGLGEGPHEHVPNANVRRPRPASRKE